MSIKVATVKLIIEKDSANNFLLYYLQKCNAKVIVYKINEETSFSKVKDNSLIWTFSDICSTEVQWQLVRISNLSYYVYRVILSISRVYIR